MREFYTYLHCRPNGMPFYLGKGTGRRAYDFINGRNRHHRRVVSKHGKQNIQVFIFPCDSEHQALSDEVHQIAQLRRDGYLLVNVCDGGEGPSGHVQSPEHVAKRVARSIGNKANRGRIFTPEHRAKIGAGHKGKKVSTETRGKLRAKALGNKNCAGRLMPSETRAKISAGHALRWQSVRASRPKSTKVFSESHKSAISSVMRKLWDDPSYRSMMAAARKKKGHAS